MDYEASSNRTREFLTSALGRGEAIGRGGIALSSLAPHALVRIDTTREGGEAELRDFIAWQNASDVQQVACGKEVNGEVWILFAHAPIIRAVGEWFAERRKQQQRADVLKAFGA